jgi:hypothetical protein
MGEPREPVHSRTIHAAHDYCTGAPLHDLERWDVLASPDDFGLPLDAEYHSGYRDTDGRLHRLYVRRAAPTMPAPDCATCAGKRAR